MTVISTDITNKKKKRLAFLIGFLFHAGLLLCFLFTGFTEPDPLPEETFIQIAVADLGVTDNGSGDIESKVVSNNNSAAEEVSNVDPTEEELTVTDATSNELTQEKESTVQASKETDAERREKKAREKVNSLAQNAFGNNNEGASDGNSSGTGNQGNPNSNPAGRGVLGNGAGSWSLVGRSIEVIPKPRNNFQDKGLVVLDFYVDRNGRIIPSRTRVNSLKSVNATPTLVALAKEALAKAKFSKKFDAPPMQKGNFIFNFTVR